VRRADPLGRCELAGARKLAVEEQEANLFEATVLDQIADVIAAIAQNSALTIDRGDPRIYRYDAPQAFIAIRHELLLYPTGRAGTGQTVRKTRAWNLFSGCDRDHRRGLEAYFLSTW